jgi:hypothetical protein
MSMSTGRSMHVRLCIPGPVASAPCLDVPATQATLDALLLARSKATIRKMRASRSPSILDSIAWSC